jgi:hypothetical protein
MDEGRFQLVRARSLNSPLWDKSPDQTRPCAVGRSACDRRVTHHWEPVLGEDDEKTRLSAGAIANNYQLFAVFLRHDESVCEETRVALVKMKEEKQKREKRAFDLWNLSGAAFF